MTDIFDRATEIEEMQRAAALAAQAQKYSNAPAVSTFECENCGDLIPEARRAAVIGCRYCVSCQQDLEKYGKTR